MALAQTITIRRATRANRLRQVRAETRVDEQLRIEHAGDLIAGYTEADKVSDQRFIRAARALHSLLNSEEQRNALYILIAEWERDEATEERIVAEQGDHNHTMLALHRAATPMFVDGQFVYDGEEAGA